MNGQTVTEIEQNNHASTAGGPDPGTAAPDRQDEVQEWRDRALRLQAEMENYRKRQQRLAQVEIQSERERLLDNFLQIVDDLERALAAQDRAGAESGAVEHSAWNLSSRAGRTSQTDLVRGVELTYRSARQLLQKEGVEPIEALHQPFDPNWHEAVTTVPRNGHDVEPGTVIRVLQAGYRLGDHLLRPAKVVVAI